MKQKTLIPLIVFLLGICLVGIILYKVDSHETAQNHTTALLNATTYGERIKNEITEGIDVTDVLKQILISESGEFNQFDMIAENLMSDSIESVQLAPNGVVTDIYPSAGNEAGKIDLLHDKDRGKISCYARDNHTIITQGPFKLKQGGSGIAVRNPIFLKDENGLEYFWGFTIVVLRVPDIFSDAVSALSSFGYEYRISKTDAPWSDTYNIVSQSNDSLINPVSYTFTIGEEEWMFEVAPQGGWRNNLLIAKTSVILTANVILLSVLTCVWLTSKENKNRFQILIEFFMLTIGSIIAAFAIEEFLVPNTILDGGVIGIGIMINNLTKLPLSMLTIILNIPFLLFGLHKLGKISIIKAAYCMIIFSLFVSLFAPWTNGSHNEPCRLFH